MAAETKNRLVNQKALSMGVFTFETVLNIGMLLTKSLKAKELRSFILNIVIDVLNKKMGGSTQIYQSARKRIFAKCYQET